jgi:pimeloyl-ACP methyl ester carboxylesterase
VTSDRWFAGGERLRIALAAGSFEIFCRVGGSGPWLTALHGFPTSSWDWAKATPSLERRFRVLCLDFLGFGDSDKPRAHRYSIFEQADLTEALWRALGIEDTGVVAHDYGATVAQELLARSETAARVTGVTCLNAAVYVRLARPLLIQRLLAGRLTGPIVAHAVTERTFRRSFESIFSPQHPIDEPEIHEHWRVLERRGGSARLSHRLSHYMGDRKRHADRWETALEKAHCPVSFIWGMADPRSGGHIAEEIRRRLPLAPFVELPDVGHYPQLEVPAAVASEIAAAASRWREPRSNRLPADP